MEPPVPCFADLTLPRLATMSDVAQWFCLTPGELGWLADPEARQNRIPPGPLHHYLYQWQKKKHGKPRLIESPKTYLKTIQRRILHEILDLLPVHEAAHGFKKGHSCVSFAVPHCGKAVLLRMDLQDFFLTIPVSRIHALFRSLGYPWAVARILTGLCTHTSADIFNALPASKRPKWQIRKQYRQPHLPQGSPASPALANLCCFRFDCRLAGLARSLNSIYTRYADDLAFSGDRDFNRKADRIHVQVGAIALEEGFQLNSKKTRIMRASVSQRLTGMVVNQHPNIQRREYDILKAILYNCHRYGHQSQNRDGHQDFRAYLGGRVSWVETVNPERGLRLRNLINSINWLEQHPSSVIRQTS